MNTSETDNRSPHRKGTTEFRREIANGLIGIAPQILWFVFAIMAFAALYGPFLKLLEHGDVNKVSVFQIQVEFAQKHFAQADAPGRIPTPEAFRPFEERILRLAPKIAEQKCCGLMTITCNKICRSGVRLTPLA
jgi:hypothetical protein